MAETRILFMVKGRSESSNLKCSWLTLLDSDRVNDPCYGAEKHVNTVS